MSSEAPPPEDPKARRNKIISRLMIIALGLLVLAYAIPTVISAIPRR